MVKSRYSKLENRDTVSGKMEILFVLVIRIKITLFAFIKAISLEVLSNIATVLCIVNNKYYYNL